MQRIRNCRIIQSFVCAFVCVCVRTCISMYMWYCIGGGTCTTGDLRLVNSYTNSYGRSEGRVEVCYNNIWGTICDYDWDTSYEAQTACNELGYSRSGLDVLVLCNSIFTLFLLGATAYTYSYFGSGTGPYWLSDVDCYSYSTKIWDCPHDGIGVVQSYCTPQSHSYDAGARCYGNINSKILL